jgi:hypothetical protein
MLGLFIAASAVTAGREAQHATRDASRASNRASQAHDEVTLLRSDVEKLLMISEALWTMLKEQHGYTDEQLSKRVEEIDMRDGKLDGKVARNSPRACPACGKTLLRNRPVCMYCGQQVARLPFD